MYTLQADREQRAAPQAAHTLTCSGWWSRCSPSACCKRWSMPGMRAPRPHPTHARHAQRHLAGVPAAAVSYENRIRAVDGVTRVAYANWFGGVYKDPKNFFAQFAVSGQATSTSTRTSSCRRTTAPPSCATARAALVGRKLADQYGFKVGDVIPIKARSIPAPGSCGARHYGRPHESTITRQMFFHWDYLNETRCSRNPRRAGPTRLACTWCSIEPGRRGRRDLAPRRRHVFRNSLAETLTETEKAFQLGFVSMSKRSWRRSRGVVRGDRDHHGGDGQHDGDERARAPVEYATLKALGFGPGFLAR
jgi:putative ABC transport system permease protein